MAVATESPATRQTEVFVPELVYFEPDALNYPKGQKIWQWAKEQGLPIHMTTSHNRITNLPGDSDLEKYRIAKRTLVVGIRKTLKFDTSKPSAEYAIPIATGCMAHCHYCYLQTTLGAKPYIRVYVNTDDILQAAKRYIDERAPEITRFEAACTSDPVGLEHISGSLKELIEFMGREPLGRLRFVTKFHHVEPLLDAKHNKHTRFRFSVNADYVIKHFEPATSSFRERITAAGKVAQAGYPLGFIVAPIIWHEGWEEGYRELLGKLKEALPEEATSDLTFELIQHRFTKTAKNVILQRYPKTKLELDETKRKYKWGRWGQGKYVYPDEQATALREFITEQIFEKFPSATIDYFT
ncbi:spore photoproduct lyase [Paenibacillus doosanensis]|uniref:spore photoproduct lyase n=1 Tax=Paenibacillus doosanensis TaxID=1229154 RepID=UPI0021808903|nr:spore photoproduct lyase [Paenibacillus doosanensis]MCS7458544.1 spore photoproduct lyase [Paenibacillus doosanensis]